MHYISLPLALTPEWPMTRTAPEEVTLLLKAWSSGDQAALDRLMPLVYGELHRLARRYMRRERPDHSLQTTDLVHEAYLRLVDAKGIAWQERAQFFAVSATLMRRILVEFARSHGCSKRGGQAQKVKLEEGCSCMSPRDADLVCLDEALETLAAFDPRKAKVVELRFFGGLSVAEAAEVLEVSEDTVLRDWRLAKVWLIREIRSCAT